VLLVVALLLASRAVAGPATQIAAHRGGAALPENSLAAFRGALALGVDALEFDVHLTADGEPVVIHDATLERTTTGRGAVADTTLAQLRALRVRGRDGGPTTESVPTLAEVLDLAAPTAVEVLPEIKTARGGRRYAGLEDKVLARLGARRFAGRATVQAFDEATIRRLRELDQAQRTMLLVPARRLEMARVEATEAVRWAGELGATDLGMDHRTIDARVIVAARAARVRLSAWTVNAEPDLRRILDLGVDMVMSDHPDLALRLAGRAPLKP
jgi:glycerophosphoryl diester phosphodiesterase